MQWDDRVEASALEFLQAQDGARPFAAWVHFYDVHRPYNPPAGYDLYRHADGLPEALRAPGPDSGPARSAERAIEQTMNAAAFATERKDRLVEELRLWRVLIAAAFEGRLDRISDRFADYRRRLERRRTAEPQKQSGAGEAPLSETLSNSGRYLW